MQDLIEIWYFELEMTKNRNKMLFEGHSDEYDLNFLSIGNCSHFGGDISIGILDLVFPKETHKTNHMG